MSSNDIKATVFIVCLFVGLPLAFLFLRDIFVRRRFKRPMFWLTLPFLLLFAVLMPLCIPQWNTSRVLLMVGLELVILFLLLGLFGFAWAFRALCGLIFLAYFTYLVSEFVFGEKSFSLQGRRSDVSPRNALLGFIVIGLPSLWFAVLGRFSLRLPPTPEELAAAQKEDDERLLKPDWKFYEQHLKRPVPTALRQLYADSELITMQGVDVGGDYPINEFMPIDEKSMTELGEINLEIFAIAINECGDPIYLRPGASEPDKVYVTYHDGGETEVLAESVDVFVEKLKGNVQRKSRLQ